MVGKTALEAAVTSKSQAWRGPSSPTSRYKVEKLIREYNFLVEVLIWDINPKSRRLPIDVHLDRIAAIYWAASPVGKINGTGAGVGT